MVTNRAAEDDLGPAFGQRHPVSGHLERQTVGGQRDPVVSMSRGTHTVMLKPVAGGHGLNLFPSVGTRRFDPALRR
jgi:hypothetical protein